MHLPLLKLSQLLGSFTPVLAILILCASASDPTLLVAADVESLPPEDHNHDRLLGTTHIGIEDLDVRNIERYGEGYLGYGIEIVGRTPQAPTATDPHVLTNNVPSTDNLEQGETKAYSFLKASVFGTLTPATSSLVSAIGSRSPLDNGKHWIGADEVEGEQASEIMPRQESEGDSRTVYISVNTCLQPVPIQNTTVEPPPQLRLFISQSQNNTSPGPTKDSSSQEVRLLEGGAAMVTLNATGDLFFGLYGETTSAYKGVWSAQIAASIDGYYHTFHNGSDPDHRAKLANLGVVDADSSSTLLVTGNLTNAFPNSTVYDDWMKASPPFVLFASKADDPTVYGLQNSYCALSQLANIRPVNGGFPGNVQTSITNMSWGGNNQPRQQFHLSELEKETSYNVMLGMFGNSTSNGNIVGGGGQIWPMQTVKTLRDGNCALIFNLSFCSQTAYSVPANFNNFPNVTSLASFYDDAARAKYAFFEKVIAQIPCETTSSAQYSLVRTCDHCAIAYKEWLCAVTIPRCTDWTANSLDEPWLQQRNMLQPWPFPNSSLIEDYDLLKSANKSLSQKSSRNPDIDSVVQPGAYNEVLPCDDLCYNIVQSCPAALGFTCPRPGQVSFNASYAVTKEGKCNYPGSQGVSSSGTRIRSGYIMTFIALAASGAMFI